MRNQNKKHLKAANSCSNISVNAFSIVKQIFYCNKKIKKSSSNISVNAFSIVKQIFYCDKKIKKSSSNISVNAFSIVKQIFYCDKKIKKSPGIGVKFCISANDFLISCLCQNSMPSACSVLYECFSLATWQKESTKNKTIET